MARATASEMQRIAWCSQHQSSPRNHPTPPAPETPEVSKWGRTRTRQLCYAPHFPMMLDYLSGEEKINLHLSIKNQHPWVAHRLSRRIKHTSRTQHSIYSGTVSELKSWWKLSEAFCIFKRKLCAQNSCWHGPRWTSPSLCTVSTPTPALETREPGAAEYTCPPVEIACRLLFWLHQKA